MAGPTDVVKHSATIQISHSITLLQHRAWNVLLANAYDDLPTQTRFSMPLSELVRSLDITTRNTAHLRETLKGLVGSTVEFNLLGKDKTRVWGAMALLSSVIIRESGVVEYEYPSRLRELLHNPAVYSRIQLSTANRFRSSHSLGLYEVLVDYRGVGRTPWMTVETFRKLMGLKADEYVEFKRLSAQVITPALKEINEHSDLAATVHYKRENRAIVEIQFECAQKPERPDTAPVQIGGKPTRAPRSTAASPARRSLSAPGPTSTSARPPTASPSGPVPTLFDLPDAFEAWLSDLPDDVASSHRRQAERFVDRSQPGLGPRSREAAILTRMRETWHSGPLQHDGP